jgi:uncharacterized protein (TIGR03067 family)
MLLSKRRLAILLLLLTAVLLAGGTAVPGGRAPAAPPAVDKPPRDAKADETPTGDLAKLQGRWKLVKLEPAKFQEKQEIIWDIKDHTIRVLLKGEEALRCEFTLDDKVDPKRMDVTIPQANGTKKTALGIYKIEGDTLTVCQSRPERDAPKEFKPAAGGPFPSVAVYQR